MRVGVASIVLAGCNFAYGLDETRLTPPDLDLDGVDDELDNCADVANAGQADRDLDGFGDACDGCPDQHDLANHDEDGDRRGDACDICAIASDFGEDQDGDGVGDRCEQQPGATRLEAFDGFARLDLERWQALAGTWLLAGDAITSEAPGAALRGTSIATAAHGYVELGLTSLRPWQPGDRFGLAIVASDRAIVACDVECAATCDAVLRVDGVELTRVTLMPRPDGTLRLITLANRATCVVMGAALSAPFVTPQSGVPEIRGTPDVLTRYIAVWSHQS